jgi:hypothetical protein
LYSARTKLAIRLRSKTRLQCRSSCPIRQVRVLSFELRSAALCRAPTVLWQYPTVPWQYPRTDPAGRRSKFELQSRDLTAPDKLLEMLALFCESARWDPAYCVPDLDKHLKPDLDTARAALGLPFGSPSLPSRNSVGFADGEEGQLGPRRIVVGFAWRMNRADVRRFVLSAARAFRVNTRTSVVLVCLPSDLPDLYDLATELRPLTTGVGAEVNLHMYPCLGKDHRDEMGFIAFFRYRCLAKMLSLSGRANSVLDIDPFDEVLLSDVRDVRKPPRVLRHLCACVCKARACARVCLFCNDAGALPSRPV